jgi:ComF family protein
MDPRVTPLARAVRGLATVALDFLWPRACVACDGGMRAGEDGLVCGACWSRLAELPWPRCARCGHPLRTERGAGHGRDAPCAWCETWAPHVRAIRSVAWMPGGVAGRIVHALKYESWTNVADGMAARMARVTWPRDVVEERSAIVPVPLAATRLRERGYNQSALLATGLASRWSLPVWDDVLERVRATEQQARLTRDERLGNVSGAFRHRAGASSRLRGRHVVLVDDVVTTAATLSACAAALVEGGARIVSCVTFGRARAAGDRT